MNRGVDNARPVLLRRQQGACPIADRGVRSIRNGRACLRRICPRLMSGTTARVVIKGTHRADRPDA